MYPGKNPEKVPSPKETPEYINVAVAVVEQGGKFLVAKLAADKPYAGKWEFPGGKLRLGESAQEALQREAMEELGIEVEVKQVFPQLDYDYRRPDGKLFRLHGFLCNIGAGPLKIDEHTEIRWVTPEEMKKMDFLESDKLLFPLLENYLKKRT